LAIRVTAALKCPTIVPNLGELSPNMRYRDKSQAAIA